MNFGPNISTDNSPIYGNGAGRLSSTCATGRTITGEIIQVSRRWRDARKVAALAISKGMVTGSVSVRVQTKNLRSAEIARHEFSI